MKIPNWIVAFRPLECSWSSRENASEKKAGVVENPQVLDHAGLLFDRPPE